MSILNETPDSLNQTALQHIKDTTKSLLDYLYRYTAWKHMVHNIETTTIGDGKGLNHQRDTLLGRSYRIMLTDKYYRRFEIKPSSTPPNLCDTHRVPYGDVIRTNHTLRYRESISRGAVANDNFAESHKAFFSPRKDQLVKKYIKTFSELGLFDIELLESHYNMVCKHLSILGTNINLFPKFNKEDIEKMYI